MYRSNTRKHQRNYNCLGKNGSLIPSLIVNKRLIQCPLLVISTLIVVLLLLDLFISFRCKLRDQRILVVKKEIINIATGKEALNLVILP